MKIENAHKKHFALGIRYLFDSMPIFRKQIDLARAADVPAPTITAVMRGTETKFPGYENQIKIARAFKKELHEVLEIGKEIDSGKQIESPKKINNLDVKEHIQEGDFVVKHKELVTGFPPEWQGLALLINKDLLEISKIDPDKLWEIARTISMALRESKKTHDRRKGERRQEQIRPEMLKSNGDRRSGQDRRDTN